MLSSRPCSGTSWWRWTWRGRLRWRIWAWRFAAWSLSLHVLLSDWSLTSRCLSAQYWYSEACLRLQWPPHLSWTAPRSPVQTLSYHWPSWACLLRVLRALLMHLFPLHRNRPSHPSWTLLLISACFMLTALQNHAKRVRSRLYWDSCLPLAIFVKNLLLLSVTFLSRFSVAKEQSMLTFLAAKAC